MISSSFLRHSDETKTLLTSQAQICAIGADGKQQAVVTGGSSRWQEALARAATREGIFIINPDLADIVNDEIECIKIEQAVAVWREARRELKTARHAGQNIAGQYEFGQKLLEAARQLHALKPFAQLNENESRRLLKDMEALHTVQEHLVRLPEGQTSNANRSRSGPGP